MTVNVAECSACDAISAGTDALDWAVQHAASTGHRTTTHEPI